MLFFCVIVAISTIAKKSDYFTQWPVAFCFLLLRNHKAAYDFKALLKNNILEVSIHVLDA